MTEPEAGSAGSDTIVARARSPVPAIAFALIAPFAVAAYLTSAISMEAFFCPPGGWKSGSLGSVASLQVGVFLIVVCVAVLVLRSSSRLAERPLSPPLAFLRTIARNDYYCITTTLYSLLIVAGLWLNYLTSYYCVGPIGIVVRTSLIAAPRTSHWDNVRTVQAHCALTRSGLEGSLTLILDTGVTIPLPLKILRSGSAQGDYDPIRTALTGRQYQFRLSPSVTQNTCPPELYGVFTTWPR